MATVGFVWWLTDRTQPMKRLLLSLLWITFTRQQPKNHQDIPSLLSLPIQEQVIVDGIQMIVVQDIAEEKELQLLFRGLQLLCELAHK